MTDVVPPAAPPLDLPHYGIGPVGAVLRFIQKYATFSGRASRSEYWWIVAAFGIVSVPLSIINAAAAAASATIDESRAGPPGLLTTAVTVIAVIAALVLITPTVAVTVRRLHDANLSGWVYLLNLVPVLGALMLAAIALRPSNPLGSRFDAAGPGAAARNSGNSAGRTAAPAP